MILTPWISAVTSSSADLTHSLFIDVWTPSNATADSKLPVKVWLYGGGNQAGGISDALYDGCFASTNTIQVSINYRVGPLGFLAVEGLNLTGNQGIQDQLLGLQWVQENVGAFGGDPRKVLLFGQSAGALDTYIISSLPQAKSLISAAVLESGSGQNISTAAAAKDSNEAFVKGLNCSTTDVSCVRAASIQAINATVAGMGATGTSISSLGVIVDGKTIPAQPLEAGIKVPAIAGSTTNEGTLFILGQYRENVVLLNSSNYDQYLTTTFGPLAQQVNGTYPLSQYSTAIAPVLAAMSAVMTHSNFRCPTRRFVRRAAADGMPVWTYSFNHSLTCAWYASIPSYALPLLGSTHTAEIPFVFGQVDSLARPNGNCSLTPAEKALSVTMMAAWDGMAADASPGDGWPEYTADGSMGVNVVGTDFAAGEVDYSMCDFWDSIAAQTSGGGNSSSGTAGGSGVGTSGSSGGSDWISMATVGACTVVLTWFLAFHA